jgi:hypothetical protein
MRSDAQRRADKALHDTRLCVDWLLALMRQSPVRTRTKASLRAEARKTLGISKNAFEHGWIFAIERTGNYEWDGRLRRHNKGAPS